MSQMDSRHVTLAAGTVATVTLGADYNYVEVINMSGTAAAYFTVNGAAPTVKGNGTIPLPAAIGAGAKLEASGSQPTVVRLISAGTPDISVRGW